MNETRKYDDIINLEHPTSKVHKRMSKEARAAQFAPFAALTGHDDAVKETERRTEEKKYMDENSKNILDEIILKIQSKIKSEPLVSITYFVPDNKKKGGKYITVTDYIKKIDDYERLIVLKNKTKIKFQDIIDIYEME